MSDKLKTIPDIIAEMRGFKRYATSDSADIPPEVFALACRRSKDCPMMKGGAE